MIRYDRIDDFRVPEAFVYLCCATGFAPNNYAPVFHLGKGRVKKVVICCGAAPESHDPSDQKHAIKPARALQKMLAAQLNPTSTSAVDIQLFYGDPNRPSDWLRLGAFVKAFADGLPVIANLQGGTAQMSLGIDRALETAKLDWLMVTVTKPPIQTAVTALFGNRIDEKFIPLNEVAENIPRELLFSVRGLEPDTIEAKNQRTYYEQRTDLATRIWDKMAGSEQARRALAQLNTANYDESSSNAPLNLAALNLAETALRLIADIFELEADNLQIVNRHLSSFLTGGWLEQAALNHLTRHFVKRRDVTFTLNVPLCKIGGRDLEGEVDILVQHGENFHVVELKTSAGAKQLRAKHRNQTANNRNMVGGEMARAWLVMPFLTGDGEYVRQLKASCNLSQVSLIAGLGAFDQLARQIEALVEG